MFNNELSPHKCFQLRCYNATSLSQVWVSSFRNESSNFSNGAPPPLGVYSSIIYYKLLTSFLLERTRGAGAPEVLRRETAEEEFRLRRNQPLNMAPSAPKYRYCQAVFFCATFSKKSIFGGSRKVSLNSVKWVIFGTLVGTPKKCVSKIAYEADANFRHRFEAFSWTHRQTNIPQTRTSYLGTGVAD